MNVFRKFFAFLRLRDAVRKADALFQSTGHRHYVMPASDGRLLILDRANFRKLKQKRYIDSSVFCSDLLSGCFYHTPCRDGSGVIPPSVLSRKRREYFSWFAQTSKARRR